MSVTNPLQPSEASSALLRPIAGRDHIQGPINAAIQLVEFGDYQCRQCGHTHATIKALQKRLGNRLCFAFRHFPMANSQPGSQHAAQAAEAAGAQGKYWPMHDLLLEHHSALTDDDLAQYSRDLGLNTPRLMREVFQASYSDKLREDANMGKALGVASSPALFVNGQLCEGPLTFFALLAEAASRFTAHPKPAPVAPTSSQPWRA